MWGFNIGHLGMGDSSQDFKQPRQGPDVVVLPPILFGAAWLIGFALDALTGATLGRVVGSLLVLPGQLLGVAAIVIAVVAVVQFQVAGTNVEPTKPAHELVTNGIYALSRNPIYLAFILLGTGLALAFDAPLVLIATAIAVPILRWGVIAREETYLAAEFGDAYDAYRRRVGRWFGRTAD